LKKGWSYYGTEKYVLITAYNVAVQTKCAKDKKLNVTIKNVCHNTLNTLEQLHKQNTKTKIQITGERQH
jgi:hypothetical protein